MRVVVVGATGNMGTSVLRSLGASEEVESVLGIARRAPDWDPPKTTWAQADVVSSDLVPHFRGADAVVHLAWLIQPSRDQRQVHAVNVEGSRRVFEAAAEAGVPTLAYASSVGAYSRGPKDRAVDESWPTEGIPTSFYSRHKAEVERILDDFERTSPDTRVVRMRPALVFKGDAAEEVRRLFAGPFLPSFLVRRGLIPVAPRIRGLRFQAVHSHDVGEAFRLALTREARGAFNLAADPVIGPSELAAALDAREVPLHAGLVRALADLTYRLRLQPTPPGWLDMALGVPVMDSSRARNELGWSPAHSSIDALLELLAGINEQSGMPTPPLDPDTAGPGRLGELKSGVGRRS